jgi:hypothetical protein
VEQQVLVFHLGRAIRSALLAAARLFFGPTKQDPRQSRNDPALNDLPGADDGSPGNM